MGLCCQNVEHSEVAVARLALVVGVSVISLHVGHCGHFLNMPIMPVLGWLLTNSSCCQLAESFCLLSYSLPLLWWVLSGGHLHGTQRSSLFFLPLLCFYSYVFTPEHLVSDLVAFPSRLLTTSHESKYSHLRPLFLACKMDDQIHHLSSMHWEDFLSHYHSLLNVV